MARHLVIDDEVALSPGSEYSVDDIGLTLRVTENVTVEVNRLDDPFYTTIITVQRQDPVR